MRKSGRHEDMRIGAEPRAQLLPPEVRTRQAGRRLRSHANIAVVLVLVVMLVATGLAGYAAVQAQFALTAAQDRTVKLLGQQAEFSEMRQLRSEVAKVKAGQQVGASTEIDWSSYLAKVQATVPAGVAITSINVQAASPLELFQQAATPLASQRVASITLQATSPDVATVQTWLDTLVTLPGYADAFVGSVTLGEGGYQVSLVLGLNEQAFAHRFVDEADDAADEPVEPTAEASATEGD